MSLLTEAKKISTRKIRIKPSTEEIELALAWVREEVSNSQVAMVLGVSSANVYPKLAIALRQYIITKK